MLLLDFARPMKRADNCEKMVTRISFSDYRHRAAHSNPLTAIVCQKECREQPFFVSRGQGQRPIISLRSLLMIITTIISAFRTSKLHRFIIGVPESPWLPLSLLLDNLSRDVSRKRDELTLVRTCCSSIYGSNMTIRNYCAIATHDPRF
jgi:hypothetical protein